MLRKSTLLPGRVNRKTRLLAHAVAGAFALALPFTAFAVTITTPSTQEELVEDAAGLLLQGDDGSVMLMLANRLPLQDMPQAMQLFGIRTTMADDQRYADRNYAELASLWDSPGDGSSLFKPDGSIGQGSGTGVGLGNPPLAELVDGESKAGGTPNTGGTTASGGSEAGSGTDASSGSGTSSGKPDLVESVDPSNVKGAASPDLSIPEPLPMLLTGLGLVGIACLKRNRA